MSHFQEFTLKISACYHPLKQKSQHEADMAVVMAADTTAVEDIAAEGIEAEGVMEVIMEGIADTTADTMDTTAIMDTMAIGTDITGIGAVAGMEVIGTDIGTQSIIGDLAILGAIGTCMVVD